jgi:uncharacterized membrane protein (DUF485 family)
MSTGIYEQIRSNKKYPMMVARHRRLAGTLTAVVLGLFFAFILVVAFAPKLLAAPLTAGGVTTVAVPLGLAMVVIFWLLTGVYVRQAKHDFDEIKDEILKEVTP